MSNYHNLFQVKENESDKNLKLSKEAVQILEVLNEMEDFTLSLRKRLAEEFRTTPMAIRLVLKDFDHSR